MAITVDFVVGVAAVTYPNKGGGFYQDAASRPLLSLVVVTMGMPSVLYRLWFLGHGIAGMRRSILGAFMHGSTSARQIDGADGPSEPSMAL
ncbi:hypothetical protein NKI56_03850 [Mesorhizobium sp. M0622]|uniref:hypothetical protein n=1 Tax=unclassified Mesorhizobium TaxID=325217 RepID=UPI0033384B9D